MGAAARPSSPCGSTGALRAAGDRRVISKPGQALLPPTGAAARLSSPYGTLQTAGDRRVISKPGQALPLPMGAAVWASSMYGQAFSAF